MYTKRERLLSLNRNTNSLSFLNPLLGQRSHSIYGKIWHFSFIMFKNLVFHMSIDGLDKKRNFWLLHKTVFRKMLHYFFNMFKNIVFYMSINSSHAKRIFGLYKYNF